MVINQINARSGNLKEREVLTKLSLVLTYAGFDISVALPSAVGPDLLARSDDEVIAFEIKVYDSPESLRRAGMQDEARGGGDGPYAVHRVCAVRGDDALYTDPEIVQKLSPYSEEVRLLTFVTPARDHGFKMKL